MENVNFILGGAFILGAFLNIFGWVDLSKEVAFFCSISCFLFSLGSCYMFDNKFFKFVKRLLYSLGILILILALLLKTPKILELVTWLEINLNLTDNTILLFSIGLTFISIGLAKFDEENRNYKFKIILTEIVERLRNMGV